MKAAQVLLLAVFLAVSVAQQNCPGYTCVSASNAVGATCGQVTSTQISSCPAGYFCSYATNTSTQGKCAALLAMGTVGCIIGANDNCAPDSECVLGRSGQAYRNGHSQRSVLNTTVCQPYSYLAANGQPCNDVNACAGGLSCEYGLCAPSPTVGQACEGLDCAGSNFCNTNDICTAMFSLHVGSECTDTTDCLVGDYCNTAVYGVNGTCATSGAATNAACQTDADCKSYETCECTWTTAASATGRCVAPQVYTQAEASVISAVYECAYENSCAGPTTSFTTAQGCTACRSQYCVYFNQSLEAEASLSASSLSCLAALSLNPADLHTYCSVVSPASSVVASIAFLFMGLLVAL